MLETEATARGAVRVVGVDEAGRGPIAGPVVAAAAWIDPGKVPAGLDDSKKLTRSQRERLAAELDEVAVVSVAEASVDEIEKLNILAASMLAMRRAVEGLPFIPCLALIDGNRRPDGLPCPARPIVRGDAKSISIAAASIAAKVTRDRIMAALSRRHPGYGWEHNAGYPTKSHITALSDLGITPHHRRTFRPVHNILC